MIKKIKKTKNENTKVYLVGSGIATFASAVYLIKDAKINPKNIYIFEQDNIAGDCLDGTKKEQSFLIRGGRMQEEQFVCYWDMLSHIPSRTNANISVTDESFAFNKRYISNAQTRLLKNAEVMDVSSYDFSMQDKLDIIKLSATPKKSLENKKIKDWFSKDFFQSKFWFIWASMFAFQEWSSLIEMRRYFLRFMHLFPGLHKLGAIYRTVYNQYDSVVVPTQNWLKKQGVNFDLQVQVLDIDFNFEINLNLKRATRIHYLKNNKQSIINLEQDDYVFITNGSIVDCSDVGSLTRAPLQKSKEESGSWTLWERIAKKDSSFGKPSVFSDQIELQKWVSFTVTLKNPIFLRHLAEKYSYIPGVSGLITITDSNWLLSIVIAAQPHFVEQSADIQVFWGYGLYANTVGNYVKKTMSECTGNEILTELFAHLQISDLMQKVRDENKIDCLPVMMPFIDSLFMPRQTGDRPAVVPKGATNFAFLGQFSEIANDCVFTVEYSVRSAMIAVYTYFDTDKKVIPVYIGARKSMSLINAYKTMNR